MDNAIVATGLSLAVTVLTSLFKTVKLSSKQKNLIATGLSLVAGVATVWLGGVDLTVGNIASTGIAIYGASQIAYQFILRGTQLDKKLLTTYLFGQNPSEVEAVFEKAADLEMNVLAKPKKKATQSNDKKPVPAKKTAKPRKTAAKPDVSA